MTAKTDGMLCTWKAAASRCSASTSILARTHEPLPSAASFSSTGDSCLHGPHQSAQKSITTGTEVDRSRTSAWKVASVTSRTWGPPETAEPPASEDSGRARSPERSTAPGSRMSVGRMLTPTSLPKLSADGEPVDRHGVALGTLVVLAEDDDPQGVHRVAQLRERSADLEDRPRGVVVDRALADTVDEDGDLALTAVAHRRPGDRPAAEGQADGLTLQVGRHHVAGGGGAGGAPGARGGPP